MNLKDLYDIYNGNISAMERELRVSRQTIHQRCKKLGLTGTGNKLLKSDMSLFENKKLTRKDISNILGICTQTVDRYLNCNKLMHGNIKYSDTDIIDSLKKNNGNILKTSQELKIIYSVLHRLLKNRKISAKDYK